MNLPTARCVGHPAVDLSNPQSLNRYAYVLNNPLRYRDPLGLYCVYFGKTDENWDDAEIDSDVDQATCEGTGPEGGGTWFDNPTTTVTVNGDTGDVTWLNTGLNGYFDPFGYFNNYYAELRSTPVSPTNAQYINAIANTAAKAAPRDPDYLTCSSGYELFSGAVTRTSTGNLYVSGGVGGGGAYCSAGWLNERGNPDSFVSGFGGSRCAFAGLGGCATMSGPPGFRTSTEIGIGLGAAWSYGYTLNVTPTQQSTWPSRPVCEYNIC